MSSEHSSALAAASQVVSREEAQYGAPPLPHASFLIFRIYRIGEQIDLARAQTLAATGAERRQLPGAPHVASIQVAQPPLRLELGQRSIAVGLLRLQGALRATIYDLGVVALRLEATLPGPTDWTTAADLFRAAAELAPSDEHHFDQALQSIEQTLGPAIVRARHPEIVEDYSVLVVDSPGRDLDVAVLRVHPVVHAALLGEGRRLSPDAANLVLSMSYYPDDLALLSWNGALLIDPEGSTTAVELIEFAEVELLLMRAYDADLDKRLPGMFQGIGRSGRRLALPLVHRYGNSLHDIQRLIAEVTDITERVDNALKVTDDVYWNRLYTAMLSVLRVDVWRSGVEHKLGLLRQTYELLRDEAAALRGTVLEVTVVLLIVVEIALAVLKS
jgi:hypothetical protein